MGPFQHTIVKRLSGFILLWNFLSWSWIQISLPNVEDQNANAPAAILDFKNHDISRHPTKDLPLWQDRLRRFPVYGTAEYAQTCPWAIPRSDTSTETNTCSLLVRPSPSSGEGVSQWLSQVASSFLLVQQQSKCHIYLDYGTDIDLSSVLVPKSIDWSLPSSTSFEACELQANCHVVQELQFGVFKAKQALEEMQNTAMVGSKASPAVVGVPYYREYYHTGFRGSQYQQNLKDALPHFRIENGFACAMGALFQPVDPLPTTNKDDDYGNDDAFVISFYIRTGNTDAMLKYSNRREKVLKPEILNQFVRCAEMLEQKLVLHKTEPPMTSKYQSIVWQVVSDSPLMKRAIQNDHDGMTVTTTDGRSFNRTVRISPALGKHTRARTQPSTQDFGDAIRDWFWLGESHVVIETSSSSSAVFSFGQLASLRTARTLYEASTCEEKLPPYREQQPANRRLRDRI